MGTAFLTGKGGTGSGGGTGFTGSVGYTGSSGSTSGLFDSEIVSVKDFGAQGDGITNDLTAFRDCYAYCISNDYDMYIPEGIYIIGQTTNAGIDNGVKLQARGIRIFGDGQRSLIKRQSNTIITDYKVLWNIESANGVNTKQIIIEDFAIDSNATGNPWPEGVDLEHCCDFEIHGYNENSFIDNVTIRNMWFRDAIADHIYFPSDTHLSPDTGRNYIKSINISDCYFTDRTTFRSDICITGRPQVMNVANVKCTIFEVEINSHTLEPNCEINLVNVYCTSGIELQDAGREINSVDLPVLNPVVVNMTNCQAYTHGLFTSSVAVIATNCTFGYDGTVGSDQTSYPYLMFNMNSLFTNCRFLLETTETSLTRNLLTICHPGEQSEFEVQFNGCSFDYADKTVARSSTGGWLYCLGWSSSQITEAQNNNSCVIVKNCFFAGGMDYAIRDYQYGYVIAENNTYNTTKAFHGLFASDGGVTYGTSTASRLEIIGGVYNCSQFIHIEEWNSYGFTPIKDWIKIKNVILDNNITTTILTTSGNEPFTAVLYLCTDLTIISNSVPDQTIGKLKGMKWKLRNTTTTLTVNKPIEWICNKSEAYTAGAVDRWIPTSIMSGTTANRPTSNDVLYPGSIYYDTTLGYHVWWDGSSWRFNEGCLSLLVSTSKTLALTDIALLQKCSSASTITITIPPNSSVAFPINTEIVIVRYGTGAVTLAPGSGVTLYSSDSKKSINKQYEAVTLKKMNTDEWLLIGSLSI